ncbi:hypothetical protein T484DRAFT_1774729 [Baffinella frigidus]|nr:hypothetical protein T484DRAFT_1774729 [Cryptophyta sp. CCMP2293]
MVVVLASEGVGATVDTTAGKELKGPLQTQVSDNEITTPHGGQDWRQCANYVEDFSVTTNGLGTPASALAAAREATADLAHYPPANFEPHLSHLAGFLWGDEAAQHASCLQLGNGASELANPF